MECAALPCDSPSSRACWETVKRLEGVAKHVHGAGFVMLCYRKNMVILVCVSSESIAQHHTGGWSLCEESVMLYARDYKKEKKRETT